MTSPFSPEVVVVRGYHCGADGGVVAERTAHKHPYIHIYIYISMYVCVCI